MQQKTQKAGGLIGRCLLGGAMIINGFVTGSGCVPLTPMQEGRLFGLTTMAQRELRAKRRDKAIRETGINSGQPRYVQFEKQKYTQPEKKREKESFVCIGYQDLNNDGCIDPRDERNELIGVGNYFKCGNEYTEDNLLEILVGGVWRNVTGQNVLTKIKENNEKIVKLDEEFISSDVIEWTPLHFYKGKEIQGIYEYKVEFYKNGRLDSSKTIIFFIDYGNKREANQDNNQTKRNSKVMKDITGRVGGAMVTQGF